MKLKIPGHTSIRTSTLAQGQELTFDVFVQVDGRPVRFAAMGSALEPERISRLKSFKVSKVFIRDEDETKYRRYLDVIFEEAEQNEAMDMGTRSEVVGSRAEAAAQEYKENPDSKDAFLGSQDVFDKLGKFLGAFDESSLVILRASGSRGDDYEFHGLQVSTLAHLLAKKLDLIKNREQVTHLITAGFFHDFGAEQLGIGLNDDEAKVARKADWHKHPDLSCKYLEGKPYVDPLVIKLIAQHEETLNGSGFPRQMNPKEIEPLALILSLCNRFDHYSMKTGGDIAQAVKNFLRDQIGRYDLSQIKKIEEVFKEIRKPA